MGEPVSYAAGVPVDLRVGTTRSFAIAPGSQSPEGSWAIVDDMPVTVMPDSLHAALQRLADLPNGHKDSPVSVNAEGEADGVDVDLFDRKTGGHGPRPAGGGMHARDLMPIDEGSRNPTLYYKFFGRLINCADNDETPEQVRDAMYRQAALSGLGRTETDGIWRSIVKGVSEAHAKNGTR